MEKYYVTVFDDKGNEDILLVTTNIEEAIKRADYERYYIKRDRRKNCNVEIRVYIEDIENENCTCFDYNVIEF